MENEKYWPWRGHGYKLGWLIVSQIQEKNKTKIKKIWFAHYFTQVRIVLSTSYQV